MPLLCRVTGNLFPRSYTRRYIERAEGASPRTSTLPPPYPATVLIGAQAEFEYDAIAELVFEDAPAMRAFFAHVTHGAAAPYVAANEDMFFDRPRTKAVVVGDVIATHTLPPSY